MNWLCINHVTEESTATTVGDVFDLNMTKVKVNNSNLRVNHSIMTINDVNTYQFRKAMGW